MALPSKYGIDKKINSMEGLSAYENGGKGSGNFGHSGRPGEIGGSGDGGPTEGVDEKTKVLVDVPDEYGDKVKEYIGSSEYKTKYEKLQEARSKERTAESVMTEAGKKLAEMKSKLKSDSDGKMSAKALDEYSACKKEKLAKTSDFNRAKAERKSVEREIADGFKDAVLKGEKKGLEIEASVGKIGGTKDLLITLRKRNSSEDTAKTLNGGKGSGNFGHEGRPGEVGGSGKGSGGSNTKNIDDEIDKTKKEIKELGDFLGSVPPSGTLSSEMDSIEKVSKELEKSRKKLEKLEKEKKGSGEISLKGKSLYEKLHMIKPGDIVHLKPQDNLPNFPKKVKVDYIEDGVIHYGSSETSDGYTYPGRMIKDITKIVRKKKNSIYDEAFRKLDEIERMLNGGKGSGNFGHVGRPGLIGGSGGGNASASEWDEPYKSFTKTDQIGAGDYGEAGFFTTGNFAVDAHLGAKDVVDSVKDYNIINDMIFEAETRDHLASTPEGNRIEGLITDLKGELHAQNVYSSATFETSDIRRKILLQTAASVASIRDKLEGARGIDRYDRYIDKAVDIAKKTERRAITAANKSYDKWETHKTARPQVAGGTLTAEQDRQMTHAYDNYKKRKTKEESI